jgi:hypothetical protein
LEGQLNQVIELEREDDGRWIAEVPSLPGVMTYGDAKIWACAKVVVLAVATGIDSFRRRMKGHPSRAAQANDE